ncbi:acyltransferase domain-containing protein [Actinomadura barringtoniae]|uniref:Acyltransferase domain-containing protein n=1 Tax=Actinomadura barringtoniae TaxID=1427535 RepID=A0A939T8R8_9ACTN|nr:acyltransferase domain-containing protein [Actinomadura barringtoniae]MBO2447205.1 acyltransferase domain-containing protein [Actinomadura barringtoniae]
MTETEVATRGVPRVAGQMDADGGPVRLVFVFPGQGAQWVGMGRELAAFNPVFERAMRECADAVEAELGWSPLRRLYDDAPLTAVDEIQPTLWAFQVALAAVWRAWGVEPDLIIGHSMGEIAGATVAGALTLGDAAAVVCRRGVLLRELGGKGEMWAVGLSEAAAQEAIGEHTDLVAAGVLNSDRFTVLSGDPDALAAIIEPLRERGVFARRVNVGYASHGPQVEPVRDGLLAALAGIAPRAVATPVHSTVRDARVEGPEFDGAYWMENVRQPVRFASAVRATLADGEPTLFVELSPHPLLIPALHDGLEAAGTAGTAVPSLVRRQPDRGTLLTALGTVYAAGHDPDWSQVDTGGERVPLPVQPWQRRRLWLDLDD